MSDWQIDEMFPDGSIDVIVPESGTEVVHYVRDDSVRSEIDRLTRELEEARDVIEAQYKNIDGLIRELKERTRELEEAREALMFVTEQAIESAKRADRLRAAIESLEQCPWPESVFTCDDKEYQRLVSNPSTRTAISGFLMREGWRSAQKQIRRALEGATTEEKSE